MTEAAHADTPQAEPPRRGAHRLSPKQRKVLQELLVPGDLALALPELERKLAPSNRGAIVKAISTIPGLRVQVEAGIVRLIQEVADVADTRPSVAFAEYEPSGLASRLRLGLPGKQAAAARAAELIEGRLPRAATMMADNGTQVGLFFQELWKRFRRLPDDQRPELQLHCLNPLIAAEVVRSEPFAEVTVHGGKLDVRRCSFQGGDLGHTLGNTRFDFAILGVARATTNGFLGQPTADMLEQKRKIVKSASEVVVLLDGTKVINQSKPSCRDLMRDDLDHDHPAGVESTIKYIARETKLTLILSASLKERDEGAPIIALHEYLKEEAIENVDFELVCYDETHAEQ